MAIASGLHRLSGLILFLLLPYILYILHQSLQSEEAFFALQISLNRSCCKLLLWFFCSALIYHLLAGIRHMIMDLGWGEQVNSGKRSAIAVIVFAVILTIFLGTWIW